MFKTMCCRKFRSEISLAVSGPLKMMPQYPGMCFAVVEVSLNWIIWECQWLSPILPLLCVTGSHKTKKCREIQQLLLCQPWLHYCVSTWKISYTSIRLVQGLENTLQPCCFPSCLGRGTAVCLEWAFRQRRKILALYFASEITGFAINDCSKAGKKRCFDLLKLLMELYTLFRDVCRNGPWLFHVFLKK